MELVGSSSFRRLVKFFSRYPEVEFRRIGLGFYRIFYRGVYIGECYKEMPQVGYDITEDDPGFINKSYYEEYEDKAKLTRKVKNFVEGYYETKKSLLSKMWTFRNNNNLFEDTRKSYRQFKVK